MNHLKSFTAMIKARTMEFVRDRGAFFWNLFFPFLLIAALVLLFGGGGGSIFTIGTLGNIPAGFDLLETSGIDHINYSERGTTFEEALEPLRKHQIGMLINFETGNYYINSEAQAAELLRILMTSSSPSPGNENPGETLSAAFSLRELQVSGEAVRYADWIVPGIIGLNMMFSCFFGVGFIIIRYRKNGVLKRMKATPVSAMNFLSAQAVSRFIIIILSSTLVFVGTSIFIRFTVKGSWLNLLLIASIGVFSLISLGLFLAARIKNEELGGGIINLATWPMMLISGTFTSLEGSPPFVQSISRALPLTHILEAMRAIMIDGATLSQVLPNIIFLLIFTAVFLVLSSLLFRWE